MKIKTTSVENSYHTRVVEFKPEFGGSQRLDFTMLHCVTEIIRSSISSTVIITGNILGWVVFDTYNVPLPPDKSLNILLFAFLLWL